MLAVPKLAIVLFAFVVSGCTAASKAPRARNPAQHAEESMQYAVPEPDSVVTGQLARAGAGRQQPSPSRSFESVVEVQGGKPVETVEVGSGPPSGQDKAFPDFSRRIPVAAPSPQEPAPSAPQSPVARYADPATPAPPEGGQRPPRPSNVADAAAEQMLVYTANLTMAIYQVETGLAAVERIARENGGYLMARNDRMITIRVPQAKFEAALKAVEGTGNVAHRDIKVEDVTDEFFDTEVRVRNARAMRDRLAKLLQQAPVKEALEIEKELGRVTQEIELLEGKLKLLRHRVAYSTITVGFASLGPSITQRATPLPFPWLQDLGLTNLLQLQEGR